MRNTTTKITTTLGILISLLLGGCSGASLVVEGDYPNALTHKLPVTAGLVLDDQFQHYTYTSNEGADISIGLGSAQVELFTQILKDLFNRTIPLPSASANSSVDLIIAPHVEELQLVTPAESNAKIFEIWIKYNIQVFNNRGETIADWLMTSYGKTQDRFMASNEDALNEAAVVAMRDAGARLIIELPRVPEIRNWLEQQK
ncbi:MAG: hypothetical protein R3E73_14650 [Porticoccaceae bacterium]|nr:hypothetical protein [Pseudomonadales bacterium]MCP5303211.1 hypothetical protein [Pseudomonadales bacterium]